MILNVPYAQKDRAKSLGARWDPKGKSWYVPEGLDQQIFSEWFVCNSTNKILPKLFIDLVPRTAWFSNLRSELSEDEWGLVKKATFAPAKYICQVCGGKGDKHPVECHERWYYDLATGLQTLVGTVSLCPMCHAATHYGLAQIKGTDSAARAQLMKVNGWGIEKVQDHICCSFEEWELRNQVDWKLDARWLLSFVLLSEETTLKIWDHIEGRVQRHPK